MVMAKCKYIKPQTRTVEIQSELLDRTFMTASVGKQVSTVKDFKSEEYFKVKEDVSYEENKSFWDNWDDGAD